MFKKPLFFYLGLFLMFASTQASWVLQHSGTNTLYSIAFPRGQIDTGYACGANSLLLKTTDGGANWEVMTFGQPSGDCNDIIFPKDAQLGFVACDSGNIQRTTDGRTWRRVNDGTDSKLKAIHFPKNNTDTGYVVCDNGIIKKTINAGINWQDVSLPTRDNINGIFFLTTNKGWVVGDEGVIFSTFDGGTHWGMQLSPVTEQLFDVFFRDSLWGWIVGANKTCLRTTDGGQNWTEVTELPFVGTPDLRSILFVVNSTTGFIVGSDGKFARTNNDGATWDTATVPGANDLFALAFPLNTQIGWVCGAGEAIFKTTDGGISWIAETKFSSDRNEQRLFCQPNPSQGQIKIQLTGKLNDQATLKIFNCAGRLVRSFALNSSQPIIWNGRDKNNQRVSPGIYLFELKTEEGIAQRTKITLLN